MECAEFVYMFGQIENKRAAASNFVIRNELCKSCKSQFNSFERDTRATNLIDTH